MALLKNLLLLTGGAALGVIASRARPQVKRAGDLQVRKDSPRHLAPGSERRSEALATFFDSPYGSPFKKGALRALSFAATVKAGMQEKEEELKERFEEQTKDLRPGSLDTWGPGPSSRLEKKPDLPPLENR